MVNQAAYMTALRKMEFREIPVPEVQGDQVLVRLDYVGICGSDVHYYENGRIGDFVVNGNFILGHECGGEVVAVGPAVTKLKIGDRVALEPGQTCGKCEYCKTGRYNLCEAVEFLATPPYHGCFENYISYPEDMAFTLPEEISTKAGALLEPLCVGMEAASQGKITLGSTVTILGSGCIGLCALLAAKAYGASTVIVVDMFEKRLEKALGLGADFVVNASKEDTIERIAALTGGKGTDVVIEAAGAVKTSQQTVDIVKRGGTIVLVGMTPQDEFPFNFAKLMGKVANVQTVFRYKNQYPVAIKAISAGRIDPKKLESIASHEFAFRDLPEAFETNITQKNDVVKIVIRMS